MVRKSNLFVTNVTILDILQGIAEYLKVRIGTIRGEMHLYVSYAINLDTQQDSIEWTEGTLTRTLITEGTTTRMIEGKKMGEKIVRKKQSRNMFRNSKKHLWRLVI